MKWNFLTRTVFLPRLLRVKSVLATVLMFFSFTFGMAAHAIQIYKGNLGPNSIDLVGEIKPGDFEEVFWAFRSMELADTPVIYVRVSSPGGDLREAIKIAELFERTLVNTHSFNGCYSACVFLLVGGYERKFYGQIGVHRPSISNQYFGSLSKNKAEREYKKIQKIAKQWLTDRLVAQRVIDDMFLTPSYEITIVQNPEDVFGSKSPHTDEWLSSKCGAITEQEDLNSTAILYGEYIKAGAKFDQDTLYFAQQQAAIAATFTPEYRKDLRAKVKATNKCEADTRRKARDEALAVSP